MYVEALFVVLMCRGHHSRQNWGPIHAPNPQTQKEVVEAIPARKRVSDLLAFSPLAIQQKLATWQRATSWRLLLPALGPALPALGQVFLFRFCQPVGLAFERSPTRRRRKN